jgi:hypothetical protein
VPGVLVVATVAGMRIRRRVRVPDCGRCTVLVLPVVLVVLVFVMRVCHGR